MGATTDHEILTRRTPTLKSTQATEQQHNQVRLGLGLLILLVLMTLLFMAAYRSRPMPPIRIGEASVNRLGDVMRWKPNSDHLENEMMFRDVFRIVPETRRKAVRKSFEAAWLDETNPMPHVSFPYRGGILEVVFTRVDDTRADAVFTWR